MGAFRGAGSETIRQRFRFDPGAAAPALREEGEAGKPGEGGRGANVWAWPEKVMLCGFAGGGLRAMGVGDMLPRAVVASCHRRRQTAAKLAR